MLYELKVILDSGNTALTKAEKVDLQYKLKELMKQYNIKVINSGV